MQRTIRILRVALPVVFILFVVVIALNWRRGKPHKDKSGAVPVTSTMRPSDKPAILSMTFEDTQTINGRVASRIRAQRVVAFQSGWNTLENVQMTIYRPTGLTYDLVCPQAQFNSNTKEADAKGGVRVTSSDGVEITTAEIHFDGNHLTNHVGVNFKVDRWTGSGGALDMDVPGEMVRLYEKIDATMAPETAAESPLNIKSQEGIFRRKENYADFTKDVVAMRDDDRFNVDHMAGRFGADRKSLIALEGQGHLSIVMHGDVAPGGGKAAESSGRKTITADRFWSEIGANGQISALNFIGDTGPAHAVIEGPPNRDLVAHTFRVGLTNKQVSDIKADDNVVMKETAPIRREMTSGHLTVYFDAATHKASSAALEGNVHYKDPKNDARSVRLNYDIANDQVILTGEPGFYPSVVADGQTLKAKLIEFSPHAGIAKATGEVIAQLVSKQATGAATAVSADSTNVFPASKPVFVNADTVTMRQATKIAVFSGNVRAWQETNTVFAQEMQVQGAGDQVTARGNVRTLLYNTSTTAEARKAPMQSKSDVLVARKVDRRIDLTGNVQIDDGEQRHLSSERASFFFDANKKMDHIEAQEKVVLLEKSTGRRATGDRATYNVGRRMVYLTGAPATVTAPDGEKTGEMVVMDLVHNKVDFTSPKTPMQGTYKPKP